VHFSEIKEKGHKRKVVVSILTGPILVQSASLLFYTIFNGFSFQQINNALNFNVRPCGLACYRLVQMKNRRKQKNWNSENRIISN
jgi:hypothetical protein